MHLLEEGFKYVWINWNVKFWVRHHFWVNCVSFFLFFSYSWQAAIRKELNEFKSKEMEVHEESKQFTR